MKIPLSDSEFSEEFPTEQSSHGRRSVTGHGPAQLLSSQLLKCPPVLSEIFMFNLENGKLMELVCIYLSNAVRSILSWPRDTRVRNKVSLYTELRLRLSSARGEAGDRGWARGLWSVEAAVSASRLSLSLMMDSTQYLRSFSLTPLITECISGWITRWSD